jgi:hypothetical protein
MHIEERQVPDLLLHGLNREVWSVVTIEYNMRGGIMGA